MKSKQSFLIGTYGTLTIAKITRNQQNSVCEKEPIDLKNWFRMQWRWHLVRELHYGPNQGTPGHIPKFWNNKRLHWSFQSKPEVSMLYFLQLLQYTTALFCKQCHGNFNQSMSKNRSSGHWLPLEEDESS